MAVTAEAIRGLLALGAAAWALSGDAQAADPADWECKADLCTALISAEVAREEGVFDHGARLSTEADLGRLTDLELQSWREFRFVVADRARVSAETQLDGSYVPEDWPSDVDLASAAAVTTLHSSLDGEVYQPVDAEAVLPAGSYLSVIVTQAKDGLDSPAATFYPAKWTLEVFARRVVDATEADLADPGQVAVTYEGTTPVLQTEMPDVAAALEGELGCVGLECREQDDEPVATYEDGTPVQGDSVDPNAPDVVASDDPTLLVDPDTGDCGADMLECRPVEDPVEDVPAGDPLAAELQTELARVGCYTVGVDGLWGPGSRRAMENFNRWTGAVFPTDAPTPGALVAVARTQGPVCGVD